MNKKQKYFFVLAIITGIFLVTGATYALFTYLGVGSKVHSISTATLTMSYTEDTNGITLDGALPTTDATGKHLPNYFDFTVTKTGGIEDIINYEIVAKKEDGNTIEGKWIKLYLTETVDGQEQEVMAPTTYSEALGENEDTGRPSGMMSLTTGTYPSGTIEKHYRLRMWVSEEYNPQGDGGGLTFTVKINVYGKMKEPVKRLMAAREGSSSKENFYEYRDSITSIETKQDITVPSTALYQYDVSEAKDGNVIAYLEDDGSGNSTYKLTIGANGGVIFFNENSSYLFHWFTNLTNINLLNVDTSNVTDMNFMFRGCKSLTELDVSNFDTSNVTDMSYMFDSCESLTTLDLSNFNTSNVTNMRDMFSLSMYKSNALTSLNISSFDTSNVTNMYEMFAWCNNLTELDVSHFDTSNVTNMSYMFAYCSNLAMLDISNFNTANVESMDSMFASCRALTALDLKKFNTSQVQLMGNMFSYCSSLTTLDLSTFDTSQVIDMNTMFGSCSNLVTLNLSSFNTSNVERMSSMFAWCNNLTELDLSHFDTSNVTNMSSMFNNCSSLANLDLSNFDTSKVTDMSRMFYYCSNLTQVLVSREKWITTNANIRDMFYECGASAVTYA